MYISYNTSPYHPYLITPSLPSLSLPFSHFLLLLFTSQYNVHLLQYFAIYLAFFFFCIVITFKVCTYVIPPFDLSNRFIICYFTSMYFCMYVRIYFFSISFLFFYSFTNLFIHLFISSFYFLFRFFFIFIYLLNI